MTAASDACSAACPSHGTVLDELDRIAPGVPLLALGQTVLWDEPMKAGVAREAAKRGRRFVAGVHDTDYFAKVPGGVPPESGLAEGRRRRYRILPHNDTTTRGLWSAAGEISALFGSETVVDRDRLHAAGVGVDRVERLRPGMLDHLTEAFGWRGIASTSDRPAVVMDKPLAPLFPVFQELVEWALEKSLSRLSGPARERAEGTADQLRRILCDASAALPEDATLSDFFRALLGPMYGLTAGGEVPLEATATSELLRFAPDTVHLPRFDLVRAFVDPATREGAAAAYDAAVRGTEMYTLDRFGSWALPFDLVVPGHGRGTLRLAPKGVVVMTPDPLFATLRRPVARLEDLADVLTAKFGDRCVLVGKAIPLIGMLAREFVFVFHHGASGYVPRAREFFRRLAEAGIVLDLNPILRVRYEAWDHLEGCTTWFHLPGVLAGPFGADEVCASSFGRRWRDVGREQREVLEHLRRLRRPLDLIRFLAARAPAAWSAWLQEYEGLHVRLEVLHRDIAAIKDRKAAATRAWREAKRARAEAEAAKGRHWRERVWERSPSPADLDERERLTEAVRQAAAAVRAAAEEWRALELAQEARVSDPEVQAAHRRRRNLELEAELARARLVRSAVTASDGLSHAAHRPTAWWFPLVCPDGTWFERTVTAAEYRLEALRP